MGKRGPKRLSEDQKYGKYLRVRLKPETHQQINEVAGEEGVSEWVRQVIDETLAKKDEKRLREYIRSLVEEELAKGHKSDPEQK